MSYSEEEIQKYLNILQNYKDGLDIISPVKDELVPPETPEKVSCENCGNTHFFKDGGYRYCKKCVHSVGRVFIKEMTFKDRCCFRQKCIYKREYHYQNKIEEINRNFGLEMSSQEKFELLLKLQKIDKVMEKINEKWKRKRLINITYLMKRVLSETGESRADKIQLHLSQKILNFYDEWYDHFQKTHFIQILYKI